MSHTPAQAELMRLQALRPKPAPLSRDLPAGRRVEFRCSKKGHLVAVVYESKAGPLFVSMADDAIGDTPDEIRTNRASQLDHVSELLAQAKSDGVFESVKMLEKRPWSPEPRLPFGEEPFADRPVPTSCRCGRGPHLTLDAIAQAIPGQPTTKPAQVIVSRDGLSLGRATLFYRF